MQPRSTDRNAAEVMKRHAKAPPRPAQETDEEGLAYAHLCIQVMERFMDAVNARPEMSSRYSDLHGMFMDLVQDELAPYAFDLAYEFFSENDVVTKRWREERQES